MTIQLASSDDILEWPDGTMCYRSEFEGEYAHMSDDYLVHAVGSPSYANAEAKLWGQEP